MPRESCGHERRGDAVSRHVDPEEPHAPRAGLEEPHQVAAHMARGAQHERHLRRAEILVPAPHQGMLELARLLEVALDRRVEPPDLGQGLAAPAVGLSELLLHGQDTLARLDPRRELQAVHRLGHEVVGAGVEPLRDLGLLALRGRQDEVDVAAGLSVLPTDLGIGPQGRAELQARHPPRHHPVRQHDVEPLGPQQVEGPLRAVGLHDLDVEPAQMGHQDPPLEPAVVHHQDTATGPGFGLGRGRVRGPDRPIACLCGGCGRHQVVPLDGWSGLCLANLAGS